MNSNALVNQAIEAIRKGRRREALRHLSLAEMEAFGGEEVDHARMGTAYGWCQLPERAVPHFRAALKRNPSSPLAAYNLATMLRMTGHLAEARKIVEHLRDSTPNFLDPILLLSEVRRAGPDDNQIALLSNWLGQPRLDPKDRVRVLYALAKEYEDLAEDQLSFEMTDNGARLRRSLMRYDVAGDITVLNAIGDLHVGGGLSELGPGYAEASPIFVVGLPRSGTTLVERTIASHDEVCSIGESNTFALELVRLAKERFGNSISRRELVNAVRSIDALELGRSYCLEAAPPPNDAAAPTRLARFVDKMPLNSLYLGMIGKSLPEAAMIILHRHPLDSIYAMYKSHFDGGYPFSYDLEELAHYYVAWRRLMGRFKDSLGDRLLELEYETFVGDFESQARQLLCHSGLEWRDECLRPDRHSGASTTLSAVQIREPVHSRSVGRWERFPQLEPAASILKTAGCLG